MDYFIDFANWKETTIFFPNCGIIKLQRGEHVFGYRKVSEFLNMDMSLCVRKIKLLQTIGFMTIKSTNRYSIASVINYDIYQNDNFPDDKPDYVPTYMPARNEQQTDDKRMTLPKEYKKVKKEKKEINYPDWLDLEIWKEYKTYRQNGKGKFTPYAQQLALTKLETLRDEGNDPSEVIRRTIECGWSGLFPLKENNQKSEAQKWLEQV